MINYAPTIFRAMFCKYDVGSKWWRFPAPGDAAQTQHYQMSRYTCFPGNFAWARLNMWKVQSGRNLPVLRQLGQKQSLKLNGINESRVFHCLSVNIGAHKHTSLKWNESNIISKWQTRFQYWIGMNQTKEVCDEMTFIWAVGRYFLSSVQSNRTFLLNSLLFT